MWPGVLCAFASVVAILLLHSDGGNRPEHSAWAEAELQRAAERAAMCTSANVAGVGLRGEYYASERWGGRPLLTRTDGEIDFDASFDWPAAERQRPLSVRWTGWIKPPLTGRYRFHTNVPGARILVSRQLVAGADAQGDIEMAAGRFYPITVELSTVEELGSSARLRLEWTAPHGARFVVPRALLYMPTDAVATTRT